ncbi:MAG: hypothetical protein EAZ76_15955 [Nostocales cyanobacterium]|nr:MAG: hypothetical protein EAZ87_23000 [Nostocales cyanobacterium]TAF09860.1 MAG: hypothetical protein EAZ76_15955 [Nostocales cyanobacterium]
MGLLDGVFLTVINAVICLGLPKLLFVILSLRNKSSQLCLQNSQLKPEKLEISSFPYCTVYGVSGTQFCKFKPHFCPRCSPRG